MRAKQNGTVLALMLNLDRYEAEWEGMRLVVDACPSHWQVFVFDIENCEVLHTAQRMNLDAAKFAAVEFAAARCFGPRHDLKPEVIAEMLAWEPV